MKKRLIAPALALIIMMALLAGCSPTEATPDDGSVPIRGRIILSTTTSTYDSGLLSLLLPAFTAQTGWEVDVISVGTGVALQLGRDGEADVLLVHARAEEDRFVAEGYAERRYDVMYNDFVVVGPGDGPIAHNSDIEETFRTIAEMQLDFVSRGDNSGTHLKEIEIWEAIGIDPTINPNYISVGQGMGATLGMTREMNAFTLSDRATWLNYADRGDLVIVLEGHPILFNPYGVIPVSGSVHEQVNTEGGQAFADWIRGPSGQALIADFGVEEFGEPLFMTVDN